MRDGLRIELQRCFMSSSEVNWGRWSRREEEIHDGSDERGGDGFNLDTAETKSLGEARKRTVETPIERGRERHAMH